MTISNSVLVQVVTPTLSSGTYPEGSNVVVLSLSGLQEASVTWLSGILDLFDEFRFLELRLEWVPSAGMTTNGTILMYYDPDPTPSAPVNFAAASGNANLATSPIHSKVMIRVPGNRLNRIPWYSSHTTSTTGSAGGLIVMWSAGSIPSVSGATTVGSIWLHYRVQVRNPSNPDNSASPLSFAAAAPVLQEVVDRLRNLQSLVGGPNNPPSNGPNINDQLTSVINTALKALRVQNVTPSLAASALRLGLSAPSPIVGDRSPLPSLAEELTSEVETSI